MGSERKSDTHPTWWVGEPADLRCLSSGVQQYLCPETRKGMQWPRLPPAQLTPAPFP